MPDPAPRTVEVAAQGRHFHYHDYSYSSTDNIHNEYRHQFITRIMPDEIIALVVSGHQ